MTDNEIIKDLLENDLSQFTKFFFKVLHEDKIYYENWHIDVIARHLEEVIYGDIKNLNINIPPRTIKSLITNVMLPCWIWTKQPNYKVISCSHSADLSTGFNMERRRIIESKAFQFFWPLKIREDMNTQKSFGNIRGGFFKSVSVLGSITGKGADLLIMDDAIDALNAFSETVRERANDWFSTAFYNRLEDKKTGKRINVMQRLHEKDLTGHIEEKYDFVHLVIPMLKEKNQIENITGWVDPREEGEFLHPERYSQAEMDDEYNGLGEYGWSGQMQQSPSPASGGIIKTKWIRQEDINLNSLSKLTLSVDATFKGDKSSDYVAIQLWGKRGPDFILYDQLRGKWDFPKTLKMIRSFYTKYNPTKVLIEDKANGPAIISILKKEITGVKPIVPKSSKEARVHAISHFFELGNIIINKDLNEKEEYIRELIMFPKAAHDDMVDASTQAIQSLKSSTDLMFA